MRFYFYRLIFEFNDSISTSIVQDQNVATDVSQPSKPDSVQNEILNQDNNDELQKQLLSSVSENQKLR